LCIAGDITEIVAEFKMSGPIVVNLYSNGLINWHSGPRAVAISISIAATQTK
jgi:hypothetical protein